MIQSMTGKIVLITGAAGAIGMATAKLLAARGATIAATDNFGCGFRATARRYSRRRVPAGSGGGRDR